MKSQDLLRTKYLLSYPEPKHVTILGQTVYLFCLENSYSLGFSSSILPNHYHVLEHPVRYFNSLYLAISQQYELTLYYLLSLSLDCECLKISDCMVHRSKNRTRKMKAGKLGYLREYLVILGNISKMSWATFLSPLLPFES